MTKKGLLSWLRSGRSTTTEERERERTTLGESAGGEGLGHYTDLGEIGKGGMGSVRKVFDTRLYRTLAMKVLDPRAQGDARAAQRFREEAQITGQLAHPNIVQIHEYGADDEGTRYFTMKLVHGENLKAMLDKDPPEGRGHEALRRYLDVLLKVADAVAFAHSRGVVHRDLKPENVMVGRFGQVYLMDFGLAKVQGERRAIDVEAERVQLAFGGGVDAEGSVLGTPEYLSPEQAYGRTAQVDERTDVFGLGAILYEILAGRPLYRGELPVDRLMKARRHELEPLDEARVPAALARIAMRALSEDPAERQPSASAFHDELEQTLRGGWYFPVARFAAGELIVREGDEGDVAYIIVKGKCLAWRGAEGGAKTRLAELSAGDVFGEAAVLAKEKRTATVEALGDVTCMVVTRAALEAELALETWAGAFIRALAQRFVVVNARVRELEGRAS